MSYFGTKKKKKRWMNEINVYGVIKTPSIQVCTIYLPLRLKMYEL